MSKAIPLTNSLLKGTLTDTLCERGYCRNLDTCLSAGIYGMTPNYTTNIPPGTNGYGVVKVEVSNIYGIQTIYSRNAPTVIMIRTFISDGINPDFSPWSKIQLSLAT